jgi:WD40 repeat protein
MTGFMGIRLRLPVPPGAGPGALLGRALAIGRSQSAHAHVGGRLGLRTIQGVVPALAYSADGKWLVTSGGDRTIRSWDMRAGRELAGPTQQPRDVRVVAFGPDEKKRFLPVDDRRASAVSIAWCPA